MEKWEVLKRSIKDSDDCELDELNLIHGICILLNAVKVDPDICLVRFSWKSQPKNEMYFLSKRELAKHQVQLLAEHLPRPSKEEKGYTLQYLQYKNESCELHDIICVCMSVCVWT